MHSEYVTPKIDIDALLRRTYADNVPVGYNDKVFSLYQPGWGFDRKDLYRTGNPRGWNMAVTVELDGVPFSVSSAEFIPSYVTSYGNCASENVSVTGYKYISPKEYAAVILLAENKGERSVTVTVRAASNVTVPKEGVLSGTAAGLPITVLGDDGFCVAGRNLTRVQILNPGETAQFRILMSMTDASGEGFFADSDPLLTQKNDFRQWFLENIPFLDVPDEQMKQIYYFRWYVYRNHIRMTPDDYYIISEFLPNVRWAGLHNGINCPAGLHVEEGRWLRDQRYLSDYLSYWLDKDSSHSYSCWLASAYYERYLATGDRDFLRYTEQFKKLYQHWIDTRYDAAMGLYYQDAGKDGMESAVGGDGYRPTINTYQYADAVAISEMCKLTGDVAGAEYFAKEAEKQKAAVNEKLWDAKDSFYKVIRKNTTEKISARELLGYIPWKFKLPDDAPEFNAAWQFLMKKDGFLAEFGPRTAEYTYATRYLVSDYGGDACRWNGPSWPFATTQTLTAMANLLNEYPNQTQVNRQDYCTVLKTYVKCHYKNGEPWIAENLDADNGTWIADCGRSPNYNHSGFANLVITGLMGIRPAEGDTLTVNPLVPEEWSCFCLENVPYHGRLLTLLYDGDGSHYGQGCGFKIYADGVCISDTPSVQPLQISLPKDR